MVVSLRVLSLLAAPLSIGGVVKSVSLSVGHGTKVLGSDTLVLHEATTSACGRSCPAATTTLALTHP